MNFIDVAAACVAAYRTNQNRILKDGPAVVRGDDGNITRTFYEYGNKTLVWNYLAKTYPSSQLRQVVVQQNTPIIDLRITDKIRKEAEDILQYISSQYVLKLLRGDFISGFNTDLAKFLETGNNSSDATIAGRLGMMIYFPKLADDWRNQELMVEKMQDFAQSKHLGKIKEKLDLQVTVYKSIYSQNYNRHYIQAYTADNNVVFFSSNYAWDENKQYRIKGRVKALDTNNQRGQPMFALTRISHVKEVQ